MPSMTGTFKLVNSDNYDKYLKAIGFHALERKMLTPVSETTQITKQTDKWRIATSSVFDMSNTELQVRIFKLGEKFKETIGDDRPCRSVITQVGEDKLVHVQNYRNGVSSTIIREFTETEMKMTLFGPGNVVSTRIYQRQ